MQRSFQNDPWEASSLSRTSFPFLVRSFLPLSSKSSAWFISRPKPGTSHFRLRPGMISSTSVGRQRRSSPSAPSNILSLESSSQRDHPTGNPFIRIVSGRAVSPLPLLLPPLKSTYTCGTGKYQTTFKQMQIRKCLFLSSRTLPPGLSLPDHAHHPPHRLPLPLPRINGRHHAAERRRE